MNVEDMTKLMFKEEPLDRALEPWIQELPGGHKMLNSPLVQELFLRETHCGLVNARYYAKLEIIEAYKKGGNIHGYVFAHERPYRVDALIKLPLFFDLKPKKYWDLVGTVWTDSENIWQHHHEWRKIWESEAPEKKRAMDAKERRRLEALPNSFEVWRGVNHHGQRVDQGLSWTLSIEKAQRFARRYQSGQARLYRAEVLKKDVHALFLGRNEEEVVVRKVDRVISL